MVFSDQMKLHRIQGSDERHPGFWMVDGYAIMIAPFYDGRWQVCLHGLANDEMRAWLRPQLRNNNRFASFKEAKQFIRQALQTAPASCRLALPHLKRCNPRTYHSEDITLNAYSEGWQLSRAKTLPFWAQDAHTLYEARMLISLLPEHDRLVPPF